MYIVRFQRRDGKPDEDYYYNSFPEAHNHLALFKDDDSNLYTHIEVLEYDPHSGKTTFVDRIRFT